MGGKRYRPLEHVDKEAPEAGTGAAECMQGGPQPEQPVRFDSTECVDVQELRGGSGVPNGLSFPCVSAV